MSDAVTKAQRSNAEFSQMRAFRDKAVMNTRGWQEGASEDSANELTGG